jgi:hypothetical protein
MSGPSNPVYCISYSDWMHGCKPPAGFKPAGGYWSREVLLPVAGAACALRPACMNAWIDHCRGYDFLFFPLNPPKPPPLCFGDAREGTVGDLSSRACRGTTPLAKNSWLLRSATRSAAWSTPPGSNIKLSAQNNHPICIDRAHGLQGFGHIGNTFNQPQTTSSHQS